MGTLHCLFSFSPNRSSHPRESSITAALQIEKATAKTRFTSARLMVRQASRCCSARFLIGMLSVSAPNSNGPEGQESPAFRRGVDRRGNQAAAHAPRPLRSRQRKVPPGGPFCSRQRRLAGPPCLVSLPCRGPPRGPRPPGARRGRGTPALRPDTAPFRDRCPRAPPASRLEIGRSGLPRQTRNPLRMPLLAGRFPFPSGAESSSL